MTSLTSDQIRSYIRDGVIIRDEKGIESLKPLVGIYNEDGNLVDAPDVDFIEGGSFDLRLDTMAELVPTISKIVSPDKTQTPNLVPAIIGIKKRRTPETRECQLVVLDDGSFGYAVIPGHYYLVQTVEVISVPRNMRALVSPRTTMFRCGILLATAPVHPNYTGQLTFGLSCPSPIASFVEKGARIASVVFWYLSGEEMDLYEGVWQNGRVSTEMEEERGY